MNIIDTFMYFDEDMILDIRLNTLSKYVSKFIICEANYTHKGIPKKLNFDFKNFKKFKDKIEYLVLDHQPDDLKEIKIDDKSDTKKSKILDNALKRENYQRNFCLKKLKNFSEDDLVLINDLDEIPNLEKFKLNNKITIFKQNMYYYKLNLEYPNFKWMGSKICKIKHLINPQWLRNIKSKKYPLWRIDVVLDKKKYFNLGFVENGGWHFTNIMSPKKIDHKMRNFLHHLEYEESGYDEKKLEDLIRNKIVMYDHSADKTNQDKWKGGRVLNKVKLNNLPEYIGKNLDKLKLWLD